MVYKIVLEGLCNEKFSTVADSPREVIQKLEKKYLLDAFTSGDTIYIEVRHIKDK